MIEFSLSELSELSELSDLSDLSELAFDQHSETQFSQKAAEQTLIQETLTQEALIIMSMTGETEERVRTALRRSGYDFIAALELLVR